MKKDSVITFLYQATLFVFILTAFLTPTTNILADGTNPACPSVYGATCPSGQLAVDKKIQNPKNGEWVETLNANEITFTANQEVNFRIEVKNTGSTNLSSVAVQDRLPDYVTFTTGTGSFDVNTKVLSWTIDTLNAGESKIFFVKADVKAQSELPQAAITCLTNSAKASKDSLLATDTAGFCLQTPNAAKVFPAEQLPKTGLPLVAWSLVGFLPAGLGLRRLFKVNKANTDSPLYTWQKREFDKES